VEELGAWPTGATTGGTILSKCSLVGTVFGLPAVDAALLV